MQIEIEISGASHAITKLHEEIKSFSPNVKNLQGQHGDDDISRIVLQERIENLDDTLLKISRIVNKLEKDLSLEKRLEFRVRNLAYSEPSTGSSQFQDPFNPIPSITIQPWNPSISEISLNTY